jgi:putative transposase
VVLEKDLKIPLPKQLTDVVISLLEIIPKSRYFYAVFVFFDPATFKQVSPSDKVMSIDLGLNNLATCVTNGVIKPFIIDGKWLKYTNAHYNKRKALMQSKLERRGKKWSAKLQSLTDWRNAAVND